MTKKKSAAEVARAVEKQARTKRPAGGGAQRELDRRENKTTKTQGDF